MTFIQLFFAFIYVGLFSIGGGYASMPLIERQIVDVNNWLTGAEFADIITISQLTPGPISLNAASFVGARLSGIAGSVTATVGCILPSCVLMAMFASLYEKHRTNYIWAGALSGLRSAAVGMIAAAGLTLFIKSLTSESAVSVSFASVAIDPFAVLLCAASLYFLRAKRSNPIAVMLLCGAAGIAVYLIIGRATV